MTVFSILLVLDIVVAVVYAKAGHPNATPKSFGLKMLASSIFVLNGVISFLSSEKGVYAKLILTALVLGMLGDAFLSVDAFFKEDENKKRNTVITVVVGAFVFLTGHIIYIIAFALELKAREVFSLAMFLSAWLVLLFTAIGIKTALRVKMKKMALPMLVYAIVLSSMGAMSICLSLRGFSGNTPVQAVMIIAPMFFIISDSTLALKYADRERFGTLNIRMVTLLTYYTAQMLFGLSIMPVN